MTRAVFAAGGPAPEVFDEVTLEGRFGIVRNRLDGPTLLQRARGGAMTFGQAGAILASVCLSVHKTPPPPDVVFLRDSMDGSLRFSGDIVPKHIATGILVLDAARRRAAAGSPDDEVAVLRPRRGRAGRRPHRLRRAHVHGHRSPRGGN